MNNKVTEILKPTEISKGIINWAPETVMDTDDYMAKLRRYEKYDELLYKDLNRFVKFPIKHEHMDIWKLGEKQNGNFWVVKEIENELIRDISDWKKLNPNQQYFIKNILAFFAIADGVVNENIILNFYRDLQPAEIRYYYGSQIHIEEIHAECYSTFINNLPIPNDEKIELYKSAETNPFIKKKIDWAMKWMDDENCSVTEKLFAYALVEGIFFQGSFAAIFWLKEQRLMPGLCSGNKLIARDEGMHCEASLMIYKKFRNLLPKERIYQITQEAVNIEKEFMTEILPCRLLGMNADLMCKYIEFVADFWLKYIDVEPFYKTGNPFPFMDIISMESIDSFFETTPNNYRKAGATEESGKNVFSMDEDY